MGWLNETCFRWKRALTWTACKVMPTADKNFFVSLAQTQLIIISGLHRINWHIYNASVNQIFPVSFVRCAMIKFFYWKNCSQIYWGRLIDEKSWKEGICWFHLFISACFNKLLAQTWSLNISRFLWRVNLSESIYVTKW